MLLGGEAEAVDDALLLVLGFLDAFANGHFLFARQERDLAHLPEYIRTDRREYQTPLFLSLSFGLFDASTSAGPRCRFRGWRAWCKSGQGPPVSGRCRGARR